jgi:hypothetical protein
MSRIAQIRAAAAGTHTPGAADEEIIETETTDDGTPPPAKSKRKDDEMAEAEQNTAVETAKKEGHSAGFKAANDRMAAVMASEHYAGREAAAGKMLAKEAMSADDIIEVLAASPKVETTALTDDQQRDAAEEGGRKEMQAALKQGQNSNIDADGGKGSGQDKAAESTAIWDRAIAKVFPDARK